MLCLRRHPDELQWLPSTRGSGSIGLLSSTMRRKKLSTEGHQRMQELPRPVAVVVDDDPAIAEVVCTALEDAGYPTRAYTNPAEAFWFIGRYHPKLVILDVQMPGIDGIRLFEQLRADPSLARTAVIFLTANSHLINERLPQYARRGASLLAKPFTLTQLFTLVDTALSTS